MSMNNIRDIVKHRKIVSSIAAGILILLSFSLGVSVLINPIVENIIYKISFPILSIFLIYFIIKVLLIDAFRRFESWIPEWEDVNNSNFRKDLEEFRKKDRIDGQ